MKDNPVITARFASVCPRCGQRIDPGTRVSWERGEKAVHVACPEYSGSRQRPSKTLTSGTAPRAGASRAAESPFQPGERTVYRPSRSAADKGGNPGDVVHLPKVAGGGGSDGHWWVVISARKVRTDDEDWQIATRVRPANAAESAEFSDAATAQARHEALVRRVSSLVRTAANLTEDSPPRSARNIVVRSTVSGSNHLFLDGAIVWETYSTYDDVPRAWRSSDLRAVTAMEELLGLAPGSAAVVRLSTTGHVGQWLEAHQTAVQRAIAQAVEAA